MKTSFWTKGVVVFVGVGLLSFPSVSKGGIIFTDDYSNGSVTVPTTSLPGVVWTVESGSFSADGTTPVVQGNTGLVPNVLNIAPGGNPRISVDFGGAAGIQSSTPFSMSLDLRQGNGAGGGNYGFQISLIDSTSQRRQDILLTLNPSFFGNTGFAVYADDGGRGYGNSGAVLNGGNGWQTMTIAFNPNVGMGVTEVYKNGVLVMSYSNALAAFSTVDTIALTPIVAGVSWYVDNVSIDATAVPEPSQVQLTVMALLGLAIVVLRRRAARA